MRKSYTQIQDHLYSWLDTVIVIDDPASDTDYDEDSWREVWNAMGLEPKWVHIMLEVRLRWDSESGKLRLGSFMRHYVMLL